MALAQGLTLVQRLAADGYGLQLEVAAAEEGTSANKLSGRVILGGEVALIDGVEFVEEGEVGAGNLHIDEVVHGHASLRQRALQTIEHELDLVFNRGGWLARFGIETYSAGQIEGVSSKNAVAERGLHGLIGRVEDLARGLRSGLRERTINTQYPGSYEGDKQKTESAIHGKPPIDSFGKGIAEFPGECSLQFVSSQPAATTEIGASRAER